MTVQKETVVTAERFATGISWEQWMKDIDRNQDKFADNYEAFNLNPDDAAALKALVAKPNGPAKVLILGEAWCPDVFRGLPVIAKIAEATGMEFSVLFRDQNLDVANEFLYKGEFQSIPTVIFYTKDMKYIGHWIEKAKKAREEGPLLQAITAKMRDADISQEERQKYMAEYAAFQSGPVWGGWRNAQVTEIRELLEANT